MTPIETSFESRTEHAVAQLALCCAGFAVALAGFVLVWLLAPWLLTVAFGRPLDSVSALVAGVLGYGLCVGLLLGPCPLVLHRLADRTGVHRPLGVIAAGSLGYATVVVLTYARWLPNEPAAVASTLVLFAVPVGLHRVTERSPAPAAALGAAFVVLLATHTAFLLGHNPNVPVPPGAAP